MTSHEGKKKNEKHIAVPPIIMEMNNMDHGGQLKTGPSFSIAMIVAERVRKSSLKRMFFFRMCCSEGPCQVCGRYTDDVCNIFD